MKERMPMIKFFKRFFKTKKKIPYEYELCVVCKGETNIKRTARIDMRPNYVESIGQLCKDCARQHKVSV